jgi:uncharacterized protein YbaP (TraB family)
MRFLLAVLLLGTTLAIPAGAQDAHHPGPRDDVVDVGDAVELLEDSAADEAPPPIEIVQDYQPDPAIWLVQDEDTRIYLLGTIHVLPEGFRWRSPRLDAIVAEADELVLETSDADADVDPQIVSLFASMDKRRPVSERLSPGNGEKWLALGASTGMDPEAFDQLPPVLALFGMGFAQVEQETGAEGAYGVETVLQADFRAAGKPIGSIESAGAVMTSLLAIDEALLIKELDRELSRWDGKNFAQMLAVSPEKARAQGIDPSPLADEHAWAQGGELDIREELFGETSYSMAMGKLLLDNRNRAWAVWLERRLAQPGTVLVAVGAGHLAGYNSVHTMLARRGLTSERVN